MKREAGFTLPELLVTLAVSTVLVITLAFVSRPVDYTIDETQAERRVTMATIMQALERYKADKGHAPEDLPTKTTSLGTDGYDICKVLVPTYIKDIPIDALHGVKTINGLIETDDPCDAEGVEYYTGYTIVQNKDDSITLGEEEPVGTPLSISH